VPSSFVSPGPPVKDRSNIMRPLSFLWGTKARGDTFRFSRQRRHRLSQVITWAYPALTWYAASLAIRAINSSVVAELCAPFSTAATIVSHVQGVEIHACQWCHKLLTLGLDHWCKARTNLSSKGGSWCCIQNLDWLRTYHHRSLFRRSGPFSGSQGRRTFWLMGLHLGGAPYRVMA
jgi:hypothetical protein